MIPEPDEYDYIFSCFEYYHTIIDGDGRLSWKYRTGDDGDGGREIPQDRGC